MVWWCRLRRPVGCSVKRIRSATRYPDPPRAQLNGPTAQHSMRDGLEAHGSNRTVPQINALRERIGREFAVERVRREARGIVK